VKRHQQVEAAQLDSAELGFSREELSAPLAMGGEKTCFDAHALGERLAQAGRRGGQAAEQDEPKFARGAEPADAHPHREHEQPHCHAQATHARNDTGVKFLHRRDVGSSQAKAPVRDRRTISPVVMNEAMKARLKLIMERSA